MCVFSLCVPLGPQVEPQNQQQIHRQAGYWISQKEQVGSHLIVSNDIVKHRLHGTNDNCVLSLYLNSKD
jgi:hypothetical protein